MIWRHRRNQWFQTVAFGHGCKSRAHFVSGLTPGVSGIHSSPVKAHCQLTVYAGLLGSYGSFEAFYEVDLLRGYTAFQVSTIGSLQSFLLMFIGFFAGPIFDAGYFRHLLIGGSVLLTVGTILQSFCTQFWQFLVVEGLVIGVGCGCLCILSITITAPWFSTKLPIANAIAACGSGAGG